MQNNSANSFHPERLLYSHQKALDETVAYGAIPRRLFRVLYPIRVIGVHGRQRISTDMEEIQWFIEQAIHNAGLSTVDDLEIFFGLDAKFIHAMLSFLEKIGHVTSADGRLHLSKLGEESVAHRVSYQERETQFKLYFDAFGNRPLRQEHYRVKFYEDPPEKPGYWILPPVFTKWDADALTRLSKREDRSRYGLLDEVSNISPPVEDSFLYMPVYIVERRMDAEETSGLPVYLAFNTLPGYRDDELELSINQEPILLDWLRSTSADFQVALDRRLDAFGLGPENYRIKPDSVWGTKVFVDTAAVSQSEGRFSRDTSDQRITINHIGRYMLAADWCFLVTCEDLTIRREAAIQDCLEMLEYSHSDPSLEDVNRSMAMTNQRLDLHPGITLPMMLAEAGQRGKNRAVDRLERFS